MQKRKLLCFVAAAVMFAVMSAGTGFAANVAITAGPANVSVDNTIVGFAGYEWWVIGDANSGVYKNADSVTLFAKNDEFGKVEFRKKSDTAREGYKEYNDGFMTYWYEGSFNNPSDYKDSTLQRKMGEIAGKLNKDNLKESEKINVRTFTASSGDIGGDEISNQKLWPMSYNEWNEIKQRGICMYKEDYWLRSSIMSDLSDLADSVGNAVHSDSLDKLYAFRPALNLNVKSVILTSNAEGASAKSAVSIGGLISVTAPDITSAGKIKYTFGDSSLKLSTAYVSKIDNGTATVKYSGATAGKTLSVIVKNNSGAVTHYGRLAENTTASGEASFALPNGFNPTTDKIEIFVEEINGENESDFASTPKELDMINLKRVTVNGGTGGALYPKGEEVKLTANTPDNDKYFKGWSISPAVTLIEGTNTSGIIKFNMPDEDVTATAEYGDMVIYPVLGGDNNTWQQGSGDGLTITSEGEFSKFTGVSVDGNMLDKSQYDKKGGSTVITLKASYLSTLSVGEHIMRIHFTDGYTETRFSIAEAVEEPKVPEITVTPGETTTAQPIETTIQPTEMSAAPGEDTSPKTGDKNKLLLTLALMASAGIGIIITGALRKNKRIG